MKNNIFVDCNTGKKSQSKLLPYTLFQFIDKHSFSIICTSILILTVIGGLYVIEDQRAKHDLIETLTIKDDTSTDSSVDSDETVTTSYRGYYILFMTMGYVTLVYSIIMCNRSDPQGFQLLGDTYFPTPMIAYAIFLETLAFVSIDAHGNIIYIVFLLLGLLLCVSVIIYLYMSKNELYKSRKKEAVSLSIKTPTSKRKTTTFKLSNAFQNDPFIADSNFTGNFALLTP